MYGKTMLPSAEDTISSVLNTFVNSERQQMTQLLVKTC